MNFQFLLNARNYSGKNRQFKYLAYISNRGDLYETKIKIKLSQLYILAIRCKMAIPRNLFTYVKKGIFKSIYEKKLIFWGI